MSDVLFDEGRDRVMCKVFQWAYANNIDITLQKRRDYNSEWPELVFRRNGKCMAIGFWPATDLSAKLEYEWQKIALELCVESLNLR